MTDYRKDPMVFISELSKMALERPNYRADEDLCCPSRHDAYKLGYKRGRQEMIYEISSLARNVLACLLARENKCQEKKG